MSDYCWKCGGTGYIIVCMDDLCRSSDHCMHGDGEIVCDVCGGEYEAAMVEMGDSA
jgi:hypothetical protein